MIKYTSEDIIKRAEQLSDLENSDFISDEEKIALLNETFQILYQKIINANDKTWTKRVYIHDGELLPFDLYQISSIYIENNKKVIEKMNSNQREGYEIYNNTIHFSDSYNGETIVLEYNPVPPTLFLKEKKIDSPYNNPITANGNIYVYKNGNNEIVVADIYSDVEYVIDAIEYNDIAVYENGILFKKEDVMSIFRFDTAEVGDIPEELVPAIYNDNIYFYSKITKQVIDLEYNIYLPTLDAEVDADTYIIYFDDFRIYQLTPDYYYCNENKIDIAERKLKCILNKNLYACSELGKLWELTPKGIVIKKTDNKAIAVVNKKYVLTNRAFGNTFYLEGIMDNTCLEYPNNLFWVVISYQLAIQFKMKQNADCSQLSTMYDKAWGQFYDSISRDNNSYYQMKNVYGYKGWL